VKDYGKPLDEAFIAKLAERGFRLTAQREHVYNVLMQERDHPTAEQVFMRAKKSKPEISMATVYNCLDALVQCHLVKEVNLNRGASRYCPNMREHYHFHCGQCEQVYDIDLPLADSEKALNLPKGYQVTGFEISVKGVCPRCGGTRKNNSRN
jgi:Fur family peroxide stress response transcriptional regulator